MKKKEPQNSPQGRKPWPIMIERARSFYKHQGFEVRKFNKYECDLICIGGYKTIHVHIMTIKERFRDFEAQVESNTGLYFEAVKYKPRQKSLIPKNVISYPVKCSGNRID